MSRDAQRNMSKTIKKQRKSKEQVAEEMKQVSEIHRMRVFAKTRFYPFLIENTKSITDLKVFLQVMDTIVRAAFNDGMRTTTVGSLKLEEKISTTAPDDQQKKYHEALDMFKDETITSFIKIFSEFGQIINGLMQEKEGVLKLSDLNSPFPDEKK